MSEKTRIHPNAPAGGGGPGAFRSPRGYGRNPHWDKWHSPQPVGPTPSHSVSQHVLSAQLRPDSERVIALKRELDSGPPPGIVRTREAEEKRLGKIREQLGNDPYLNDVWLKHVSSIYGYWAKQDIQRLKNYNGDLTGLLSVDYEKGGDKNKRQFSGLLPPALVLDRQLSLLSISDAATDLMEAIGGALTRMLDRMVNSNLPVKRLIELLRDVQTTVQIPREHIEKWNAAISKRLGYWSGLQRDAYVKAAAAGLQAAKAASDAKGRKAARLRVDEAYRKASTAEKDYRTMSDDPENRLLKAAAKIETEWANLEFEAYLRARDAAKRAVSPAAKAEMEEALNRAFEAHTRCETVGGHSKYNVLNLPGLIIHERSA